MKTQNQFSDLKHLSSDSWEVCCMKLKTGPEPLDYKFGVVFYEDPACIYLRNAKGDLTNETVSFDSIEEMLKAGWLVD